MQTPATPWIRHTLSVAALTLALAWAPEARAQVQVVDMIPVMMSDEVRINSEPYLAVNPADTQLLVATAFMATPTGSPNGPLFVSTDGGATWVARNIIPSSPGSFYNTGDITIRFNGTGTALYGAILRAGTGKLEVIRTTDMTLSTPMTVLNTPRRTDQPYIYARTVTGWYDSGKDRVWVGNNESAANPASATVDQSLDAGIALPAFAQIRVDAGTPVSRDNYQVRTVAHAAGSVYVAFYRRKGSIAGGYNADVVIVRDDDWGKNMPPFQSLVDTVTLVAGQNIVASTPVSDTFGSSVALGREWWGGDLYLTVDPNDAAKVYISYSDSEFGKPRTLHLRRSTNSGQNWTPDLLTTPSAKNAAIAISSQGKIGYVYQQLAGTSPNLRWQTHLRRSTDGVVWDDVTLADFPAEGPDSPGGSRIVGDYMNMVAVGKNFYGVFSSYNDLVNASFPAGVTWLRNKTPTGDPMPRFLGVDGTTTVAASIDPFFFRTTELDPALDFYVRDWTDDASTRDHGQEPSVRANFYSTSDVWNRRSNDPQPFDVNDRPQVQDPQPAAMGHNFAFARVSREATGIAADVTLSYLYSDGGVGVPYVSAGPSTSIHLDAVDAQKTPLAGAGYQWDLPSGASNHVCLAVEISTSTDPLLSPSLLGHAPGWPTADLMVVADNNKAQRNLHVFGFGGMSGGGTRSARGMSMYAIAHNAATRVRDMKIGVAADPKRLRQLREASLRVVGRGGNDPRPVKPGDVLTLPKMAPGENRWIELTFTPTPNAREAIPIEIVELVNGRPVNGYAFVPTPMPLDRAIRETLVQHAVVFTRLHAAFGLAGAKRQAKLALRLARTRTVTPGRYAKFLQAGSKAIATLTGAFLEKCGTPDTLGAAAAVKALAAAKADPAAAQPLHLTLLNKLDVAMTMRQKADGDVGDIPQNVRWQMELFAALRTRHAFEVVERSARFLANFEKRKAGVDGFASLLASLRDAFKEAAATDTTGQAAARLKGIATAASPAKLQKAHREFLLALPVAQQPSFVETVRRSGFIFVGTVKRVGAATATIVREPSSAVVVVDHVLEALPPVGNPTGHDVTVRLRDPQKTRPGDRAAFFTYVHSAGETLGLVEVASESPDQPEALVRRIRNARETLADEALARRLASAELVVVGVFGEAKLTDAARDPVGEHDPLWWRAPIRVASFEKGRAPNEPVYVHIARNVDFLWALAPKPKAGEERIFLLQPDREKRFRVSGLFLVHPLDALPKSELERVRRLLRASR